MAGHSVNCSIASVNSSGMASKVKMVGDGDQQGDSDGRGTLLLEQVKPELKRPPMFKVVLMNDDYTPMEFVVYVLELFFALERSKATQIMLTVHTEGKATCGVFTRDIAETKAAQVTQCAVENEHPLKCEVEPA